MNRDFIIAMIVLATIILIGGTEIGIIQGQVATLVFASGSVTALLFSMMRRASVNENETIEVSGFGGRVSASGRRLVSENLLMLILFGVVIFMEYSTIQMLGHVMEVLGEQNYILSLSQPEREALRIQMPESLRRKMGR